MPDNPNPNRARDHLANERTFLAWVRTGVATIVFGFAIGRFSIALREFMKVQGYGAGSTPGLTSWLGMVSTVAGGLSRVHRDFQQMTSSNAAIAMRLYQGMPSEPEEKRTIRIRASL